MEKAENPAASERRILKKFLQRYYRMRKQQETLQARLQRMRSEFRDNESSEIEAKLRAQKREAKKSPLQIMEILAFLPQGSTERTIMELRHIDCKPWNEIMKQVHLSRSPCFMYYEKGLQRLLRYKKVQKSLAIFEAKIQRAEKDGY